ncbi:MAG: hypothetical protein HRT43_01465, partial [Campylobacteraceae bacterium]|nr:hypothetical protein [Campylobacteraceae bacterium]
MFKWLKNKTKKTNVVFDLSKDNTTQIIWSDEKYISQELARSFSSVTPKDERDKIIQNTLKHAHQNS